MKFEDLDLCPPLLEALESVGYTEPTPIQEQAIPPLLEGRDMLGCAQSGTGKTAAFALPILNHLALNPTRGRPVIRALVLCPTRELASQIKQCFVDYSANMRCQSAVVFGGVSARSQIGILRRGIDVLVATPGRLLDLEDQGYIRLDQVEFFVLDEADRMLDMGFEPDMRKIVGQIRPDRQTLLWSATWPRAVQQLARDFQRDIVQIQVGSAEITG